jgi:DNA-binding winged helix-turn-helix (wHTH) protein
MQPEQALRFGPYQLDPRTGQLWRGKHEVKVTPKAAAVLCQLVAWGGQVVSKEELFRTVWPGTVVSDAALSSCIQELRRVLGDDARKSCYIGTVHKRGFRFLAPVGSSQVPRLASRVSSLHSPTPDTLHPTPYIVGREAELQQLQDCWEKALHGERQLVFITGEPGIGKTTLVEAFVQRLESQRPGLASSVQRRASERAQRPRSTGQGAVFAPLSNPQHPTPSRGKAGITAARAV